MFARALIRAGLDIVFSKGFNPHPRIWLSLPRTVGVEGQDELLSVLVCLPPLLDRSLLQQVNSQLPAGCRITAASLLEGRVVYQPDSVEYVFTTDWPAAPDLPGRLLDCRRQLESREPIWIQRGHYGKATTRRLDIAAFLEHLDWQDGCIRLRCRVSGQGTIRTEEMLAWIGLDRQCLTAPIVRTKIKWSIPRKAGEQTDVN